MGYVITMNHLPDSFYSMPLFAKTTMTKQEAQETLLDTDGTIMAYGTLYNIVCKDIGADIYQLSLENAEY